MRVLRLTVVLVTIASLFALMYYTILELLAVWRAMTALSYQPFTAVTEQNAYMLVVNTIAFGILVMLLLVVIITVLHLSRRLL